MKDKKRLIILIIVIVLTLIVCGIIVFDYIKDDNKKPNTAEVQITNNIKDYGYVLRDTDTEYYKELFDKLKVALDKDEVDEELYATLLSQLFVTDFYTLSNKLSNSDIGGLDFVLSTVKDNFAAKAKDTMYKSVKTNLYGDREQELPTVTKVSVDNIITNNYSYGDNKDTKAYSVKCSVTYDKELGYPTTVKLTLVHTDNKLEVAKVN
nr:hypothetical protein [Bacilli bacterium]